MAVAAGDLTGLADAYDEYAAPLYSYCHWTLHGPTDAADAVEQTFVTAATEFGDLSDPGELRLWLYGVARDECYRRLSTPSSHFWSLDVVSQPAAFGGDIVHAEVRRLIWATLAGLKPRQREVVELSLRHDLNDADLAVVLGTSWSRAHALSSRARSELENGLRVLLCRAHRPGGLPSARSVADWMGWTADHADAPSGWPAHRAMPSLRRVTGLARCARRRYSTCCRRLRPRVALREQVLRRCAEGTQDAVTSPVPRS